VYVEGNNRLGAKFRRLNLSPKQPLNDYLPYDPRTELYDFSLYDYGKAGRGYELNGLGFTHKKIKKQWDRSRKQIKAEWNRARVDIEAISTKISQALVPKAIRKEVGRFYKRRGKKWLKTAWALKAGSMLPWGKAKWMGVDPDKVKYFKKGQVVGRVVVIAIAVWFVGPAIIAGIKAAGSAMASGAAIVKGKIVGAFAATAGTTAATTGAAAGGAAFSTTGAVAVTSAVGKATWVGTALKTIGPMAASYLLDQGISPASASPEEVIAATVETQEASEEEIQALMEIGATREKQKQKGKTNTMMMIGAIGIAAVIVTKGGD